MEVIFIVYETPELAEITLSTYIHTCILSHLATSSWCWFLWARNRQLSGTWLEKMRACNTCHILQEATIKQSLYSDYLDIVAKWERASEWKSPFCQSFTLHQIFLPCALPLPAKR